jgi:hypothetical protein
MMGNPWELAPEWTHLSWQVVFGDDWPITGMDVAW